MNRMTCVSWISTGFLLASLPLSAHHSANVFFDQEKTVTFTGTVTDFRFVNPHVLVYITVTDEDGNEAQWAGELTSPNRLARQSGGAHVQWHRDIIKPGDTITMTGHPARNGAPAIDIATLIDTHGVALIGGDR